MVISLAFNPIRLVAGWSFPYANSIGNGDSSGKSKKVKGKKLQFDSEDSLEYNAPMFNGKADTPALKGVNGDETQKISKKSIGKAPSPVERRLEQELPPNSLCLMDCEATEILQSIQEQMVILSQDPDIKLSVLFLSNFATERFFIMRYMKNIIKDKNFDFASNGDIW